MLRELFSHQAFVEAYFVPVQLLLIMFGMGATLGVRDFGHILRNPRGLAIGILLQSVCVPLLALAFVKGLSLSPGWAVGLILISIVPGGAFSNLLTYFAKGNVPLSISVNIVTTLGCLITIPLILRLTVAEFLPAGFDFPTAQIIKDILRFLLLPLGIGMVVYRALPQHTDKISRWAVRLSMFFVGLITLSSLGSGRIKIPEYGWAPPLTILAFALCLLLITPHISRLLGQTDDQSAAIGIQVTLRNVGIGLLLIRFFFPGQAENGHVLYSCLFYAGLGTPLALPVVFLHRKGFSPALGRRPLPPAPLWRPGA